ELSPHFVGDTIAEILVLRVAKVFKRQHCECLDGTGGWLGPRLVTSPREHEGECEEKANDGSCRHRTGYATGRQGSRCPNGCADSSGGYAASVPRRPLIGLQCTSKICGRGEPVSRGSR